MRIWWKLSLKKAGYLCDCASDGEEAVEKIGTKAYDLILLDRDASED